MKKDVILDTTRHAVYSGITVDIVEDSLSRVERLLAGIPAGTEKAVGSALARAAAAGKTVARREIVQKFTLSGSEFLARTKTINHMSEAAGHLEVSFGYRGNVIPLLSFATSIDKNGKVVTQVERGSVRATLNKAFRAQMGAHTGIYERIGPDRFPVKELYGPATPQMMYSDEKLMDAIEEKTAKTYEQRIEHELWRMLAGIGG